MAQGDQRFARPVEGSQEAPVGAEGRVGYGSAVAVIGDVVFVGAPGLQQATGAVYVYRVGDDGRFSSGGRLSSTGTSAGSGFGAEMVVAGTELLVGAPMSNGQTGAVHRYAADERTGEWREQGRYLPYDAARQSNFGTAIAQSDDEMWIGAPRSARGVGAAYIFSAAGNDGGYDGVRRLRREASDARVGFGGAIDVEGSVAAVAMANDDNGAGSVVVYERTGGDWTERAVLKSPPERIASVMGGETRCEEGNAAAFDCDGIDLLAFMNVTDLGGDRGVEVNDVWGWTDPQTGKEYALVGRVDGTSFVDISLPNGPGVNERGFLADMLQRYGDRLFAVIPAPRRGVPGELASLRTELIPISSGVSPSIDYARAGLRSPQGGRFRCFRGGHAFSEYCRLPRFVMPWTRGA